MKRAVLMVLILVIAGYAYGQFRDTEWGMSKEEVRATEEDSPTLEEATYLAYRVQTARKPALALFYFANDKLYQGVYAFTETFTNQNQYIEEFRKLDDLLSDKYGEATYDTVQWKNDLYRDDRNEYGFAVSLGHLEYITEWELETTFIQHRLSGQNYEVDHAIIYQGQELEEEMKETLQERDSEGL